MVCEKHQDKCVTLGEGGKPECWDCVDHAIANSRQVGGEHYKAKIQHWDFAASQEMDYFQGQITKYVTRWKKKNGIEDLKKAQHFLEKYLELNAPKG